tara:strand:+ start:18719 stop:19357 length:639 start_codon:yes stop_codon:yes gene_type:complete
MYTLKISMKDAEKMAEQMIAMGKISLEFARTDRATCHEDGVTRESDTDHSFMLGLTAGAFADTFLPRLNRGRVVEFALLHDLVEVYAGDVPTFKKPTPEIKKQKDDAEHAALLRIKDQFGENFPWIHETIEEYERKDTPEARFVKVIDKLEAKITNILNGGATIKVLNHTKEEIEQWKVDHDEWADEYLEEWPEIRPVWDNIVERTYKTFIS